MLLHFTAVFLNSLPVKTEKKAPVAALILTAAVVQVLLVVVYFQSSTYQAMYTLATSAIMIPFVLSALYCLKVTIHDKRLGQNNVTFKVWLISILGTVYGFWLLFATGISNIIISALMFAPGFFFYAWSRLQHHQKSLIPWQISSHLSSSLPALSSPSSWAAVWHKPRLTICDDKLKQ